MNPKRLACGSKVARAAASLAAVAILLFLGVQRVLSTAAPQGSSELTITTKSLPNAIVGVEYYAVIAATGGEPPYDFSGAGLPPGLAFHPMSDTIGGKTTSPGAYSVVITAHDSTMPTSHGTSATLKLTVVAAKR
jgi:hypothetical protein